MAKACTSREDRESEVAEEQAAERRCGRMGSKSGGTRRNGATNIWLLNRTGLQRWHRVIGCVLSVLHAHDITGRYSVAIGINNESHQQVRTCQKLCLSVQPNLLSSTAFPDSSVFVYTTSFHALVWIHNYFIWIFIQLKFFLIWNRVKRRRIFVFRIWYKSIKIPTKNTELEKNIWIYL